VSVDYIIINGNPEFYNATVMVK